MSINIETKPNAQMPTGKARSALNVAGEGWPVFVDGIFISGTIPDGLMSDYMRLHLITFVILFGHIRRCVAKILNMSRCRYIENTS
jgi:hypothetical protein